MRNLDLKSRLNLKLLAAALPILFSFVTIFYTRSSIEAFYILLSLLFVAEFSLVRVIAGKDFTKAYPYLIILFGAVGLAAAGILTIEKIELLKNPNYVTSCSVSPIVACSPVINSPQASVFTLPNPAFGILGYGLVISVGMVILAGAAKLKNWWWRLFLLGTLAGTVFVGWLVYQTLYSIGSLCLYCVAAWVVTIPTFVTTLKITSLNGSVKLPRKLKDLVEKYPLELTTTLYAIIIGLALERFWSYWLSLI